jgi:hypothetical protein
MPDLRTRIAAALQQADEGWQNYTDPYPDLADAVIAALGLRQERQQGPYSFLYRYATEWMTDE